MPSTNLFFDNLIFIAGAIINLCLVVLVVVNSRKKITSSVVTFALMTFAIVTWQISQVLGTVAPDAVTSRSIFMFNLTDIFIGIFWTHWFLALIGKVKEHRVGLGTIYATGLALLAFYLTFPMDFLVNSVPKMYFPFYYEPGRYYFIMVVWFFLVAVYYFYLLTTAYFAEQDPVQKNRFRYVLSAMTYAFALGTTAFALVFDIKIDPMIAAFCGFYTIVLAYAMVQYELLDIRILAKRAFVYAVVMVVVGLVIVATNLLGNYFTNIIPNFPPWLTSAVIAILVSSAGIYMWRKARENDIAKYEFITVIMHKFRTPLTEVKWASELIGAEREALTKEGQEALDIVEKATVSIVELTNVLISLNDTDKRSYTYSFAEFDLSTVSDPLIAEYRRRYAQKNISLIVENPTGVAMNVYTDPSKLKFAIDILLNNAMQYTPAGGTVKVSTARVGKQIQWTISDSGIGISKKAGALIFSKFYRGDNARKASTEGTGIGLYLAHEIARRSGGSLSFTSQGEGKGTTFVLALPAKDK